MKLKPLADRVVIKSVEVEKVTKSGLVLTSSAQEKPQMAEVGLQIDHDVRQRGRPRDLFQICGHRSQAGRRGVHRRQAVGYSGSCRVIREEKQHGKTD